MVFAKHHLQALDEELMRGYAGKSQEAPWPLIAEGLREWEEETENMLDQTWRQVRREIK